MFFKAIACSVFLATQFFASSSAARQSSRPRYDRRDDTDGSDNSTTSAILEPIVPPNVNEGSLSVLSLNTSVTLAWAGPSSTTTSRRLKKRDDGVMASASLTFKYPVIPLDHSTYVSDVSCSDGTLSGTLSANALAFAQKEWTDAGQILFVTSADGCGADNANDLFLATSVSFSSSDSTFTATGSSTEYKDAGLHMNFQWGNVGTTPVRRAIDKRDVRFFLFLSSTAIP